MDGWGGGWADGWGEGESVKSRIQALYKPLCPPFTIAKLLLTGRSWYTSSDDGVFVENKVDPMVGG